MTVAGTICATCFIETSSQRYKCCVESIKSTGNIIKDLNPVRFKWIDQNKGTTDQLGLIAEEVQKILPEAVDVNKNGQVEGVSYTKLVPILIKAVQELQDRVDELEKNIYTK
jgi:uncharacterized UPF0160 family protein